MSNTPAVQPMWVPEVLRFWFDELTPKQWFRIDAAVDRAIVDRFSALLRDLAATNPDALLADHRTALASIIVLDQFSRNMFRGTARAFAADAKALTLAIDSIAKGFDMKVPVAHRQSFYLPLEHAEDREHQSRSVALISAIGNETYTKYALAHQTIIERFGRFPHRNEVLGRTSTAAELAFLQEPGSSF